MDGHDHRAVARALSHPGDGDRPRVIVARTVKGMGVPFMEGKLGYHHDLSPQELSEAEAHLHERLERLRVHLPSPQAARSVPATPPHPRPRSTCRGVPSGAENA